MYRKATAASAEMLVQHEPSSIATVPVPIMADGNESGMGISGGGFVSCVTAAAPINKYVDLVEEDGEEEDMPAAAEGVVVVVPEPSVVFRHVNAKGEVTFLGEDVQLGGVLPRDCNLVRPLTLGNQSFFVFSSATSQKLEFIEVKVEAGSGSIILERAPASGAFGGGAGGFGAAPSNKPEPSLGQVSALATSGSTVLCGWSNGCLSATTLNAGGASTVRTTPCPVAGFAGCSVEQALFLQNQSAVALVSSGCIVAPVDTRTEKLSVCSSASLSQDSNYSPLRVKSSSVWREQVTALGEDGAGTAVIGTQSGGLFVYDLRATKIPLGYMAPNSGVGSGAGITSVTFLSRDIFVTTTSAGEVIQWASAAQLVAATTFPYQATPLSTAATGGAKTRIVTSCSATSAEGNTGFLTVDDCGSVELYTL